jgi:hypothetical protein
VCAYEEMRNACAMLGEMCEMVCGNKVYVHTRRMNVFMKGMMLTIKKKRGEKEASATADFSICKHPSNYPLRHLRFFFFFFFIVFIASPFSHAKLNHIVSESMEKGWGRESEKNL